MHFLFQAFRAKAVRLATAAAGGGVGSTSGGLVTTVAGGGDGEGTYRSGVSDPSISPLRSKYIHIEPVSQKCQE